MRSDAVTKGIQQAPHRSLFNALGLTKEEMERPLVGIVSSHSEIVPGHMNLDKIVEAVKIGVAMAGGTPIVFPAIAVCDGIAMGHVGMKYSLVTRDLIADSTECMAMAHQFDALVMVPNCDKNVPGLLMAAARLNIPTVFVSGGPMLAGRVKGHKTSLSSMFEAVGSYAAGTMTEADVEEFENKACPTCGSCSGMYTANSMNCLCFVLRHLVHGVVNGVIAELFGAFGELELAGAGARFRRDPHFEVLFGGIGHNFAQQFGEFGGVICLFIGISLVGFGDFGIALALGDARHRKVHADFGTFAHEVVLQTLHDLGVFHNAVAHVMLTRKLGRTLAILDGNKFGRLANGANFDIVGYDLAANSTSFHSIRSPFFWFVVCIIS